MGEDRPDLFLVRAKQIYTGHKPDLYWWGGGRMFNFGDGRMKTRLFLMGEVMETTFVFGVWQTKFVLVKANQIYLGGANQILFWWRTDTICFGRDKPGWIWWKQTRLFS